MSIELDLEVTSASANVGSAYDLYTEFNKFYYYIKEMPATIKTKLGITDENYQNFFSIYLNNPNKSLFKKNDSADDYLVDYWVSTVGGKAKFLDGFLNKKYRVIGRDFLQNLYVENIKSTNLYNIQNILLEQGIYLIFEEAKPGTKVDGVSLIINEKPVIAMSLRLKNLDSFWFTLLHELAHIVLHYELLNEPIVDYFDEENQNDISRVEQQANRLAQDVMIPKAYWRTIQTIRNESDLKNYSKLYDIHPSIIAGRLSYENNEWPKYSTLRAEYKVSV
ncbi:ImmA/IrrE family metallo-endopeptidase [Acinetobacter lactucae]|uniref:ImmA/IrrE family metallo-endopeptidase n=1 Tax=Acinetobacter lactucae TaxID=1785128 RepID=A0A3R9RHC9_9GAMM|nr:ImmA/IrrE family metallo-endopeptidase [Acinetobacter lactucae]RSO59665.1 ImmA/IrrE family metallo-endopeptidase [Acinetobacter lactucae]